MINQSIEISDMNKVIVRVNASTTEKVSVAVAEQAGMEITH